MNTAWRCFRITLLVLTLSPVIAAHDSEVVCRKQFHTSNNCYRVYQPDDPAQGLVVMLPYYGSDANEFSSAALPGLLAKKNIATMVVSASGYMRDDELATLKGLIGGVILDLN